MKIIDLFSTKEDENQVTFSLEFFPPKTPDGITNLKNRVVKFNQFNPMFIDLTWGAGGSTSELTLDLAKYWTHLTTDNNKLNVNMHLTCTNMPVDQIRTTLDQAQQHGIHNLVALRGDPPRGEDKWTRTESGFSCALDLVKYIRQNYGSDDFCISL